MKSINTTNAAAMEEVAHARDRGQTVYVETCPQYLTLDKSCYYQEDWLESAKYVCSPPLRTEFDQAVLWQGLRDGAVQTVSTDHCSFTLAQKDAGRNDFTAIPGGLPGVETRGEVVYTAGVGKRRIDLGTMCRVLSENPAKLYGLFPRKGIIAPGSDAGAWAVPHVRGGADEYAHLADALGDTYLPDLGRGIDALARRF